MTTVAHPVPALPSAAATARGGAARARRGVALHRNGALWCMLAPGIAYFVIFQLLPMVGLVVAFKDYRLNDGLMASPWAGRLGLDNFRRLFFSEQFLHALKNTLVISSLKLTSGFFAPVVLALLLNEVRVGWYKRTIQTVTYVPFFFSWVILGGIFLMVFSTGGPLNALLGAAGLRPPINFLTNGNWFIIVLVATAVWQSVGYGAVIYLAALAGIPVDLYEAAGIDGAGRWRQTLHITLPGLAPTMVVLFILSIGGILNAGFDQIYNMYNPLVFDRADIIDTFVLRRLQTLDFGVATAAGLFKSVVGLMLIVLANVVARVASGGEKGLW